MRKRCPKDSPPFAFYIVTTAICYCIGPVFSAICLMIPAFLYIFSLCGFPASFILQFTLTVVERVGDGKALVPRAGCFNDIAPMLESFLNDESHTNEFGPRLFAEGDDALGRIHYIRGSIVT